MPRTKTKTPALPMPEASTRKSAAAVARRIATSQIESLTDDPSGWIEDEHFEALMDALTGELPAHIRKDVGLEMGRRLSGGAR